MLQARFPNDERDAHHSALMRAALVGDTRAVKEMLGHGTNVNARDKEGRTALMFAVVNHHLNTAQTLLNYGADVKVKANDGFTALMLAVLGGDTEIVEALLAGGADPNQANVLVGCTALSLATERGYSVIAHLIRESSARELAIQRMVNNPTDRVVNAPASEERKIDAKSIAGIPSRCQCGADVWTDRTDGAGAETTSAANERRRATLGGSSQSVH